MILSVGQPAALNVLMNVIGAPSAHYAHYNDIVACTLSKSVNSKRERVQMTFMNALHFSSRYTYQTSGLKKASLY